MEFLHIIFIVLAILLILVSALFSGSETALTGLSKGKIHQLAKGGDKRASLIWDLHNNLASTVTTILIANQMTNHIIATITTWIVVDVYGESYVPLVAAMFGFVLIVYAEIVPKMLAISNPNGYGLAVSGILQRAIHVMKPIAKLLEKCAEKSLKFADLEMHQQKADESDEEELKGAIDLHVTGKDEKQEKRMLNNIIDLDDAEVADVMIHRGQLSTIDLDLSLEEIKKYVLNCPYTRIPVWSKNPENIIGILHTKTLLRKLANNEEKFTIESLCAQPWFIPETTKLFQQLQAFRERREHFALVVDEYGDLQGGITLEDILEEIVGEIIDESDILDDDIKMQPDGAVIVHGMVPIRELSRSLEWSLPNEEDFSTIAGLIMSQTKTIPNKGAVVEIPGFKMEILKRSKTSIDSVKITKLDS